MLQRLYLKPAGELPTYLHGLLDETGASAGMQKGLMRHANISTTINTYGRAAIKAKQEANSKVMQRMLPKASLCA